MKRLLIPIWLLGLACLFLFSCDPTNQSTDRPVIPEPDLTGIWSAIKVEYLVDEISLDVTEYSDELKISIGTQQSCCNINGCNSWTTSCDWEKSGNCILSNYFKNEDSGNVIFFKITKVEASKLIAVIENKTPELKLFPDEDSEGIYRIIFVAI